MDNYRAGCHISKQLRMFNQLDSHDTARFKPCWVKTRRACRWRWSGCLPARRAMYLYYGDEVGVDGANDPMCRKPFPWDERSGRQSCAGRCTSVWRNCVSAVWRCVVADAVRCMPKVT